MADDRIRGAFDLLERDRPVPSSAFADALFERLVQERTSSTGPRVLRRPRTPLLPPRVRTALVAAVALLVAGAVIVPFLPLAGNREQEATFAAGEVVWVRQFGADGFALSLGGIAATPSTIQVASTAYERSTYGSFRSALNAYDTDGDRRQGIELDLPAGSIATDPSGAVYVVEQAMAAGYPSEIAKFSAGGTRLWPQDRSVALEGLTGETVIWGLAADERGLYAAGGTAGSVHRQDGFVAAFDQGGNLQWATPLSTSRFDRALGVAVDDSGIYVVGSSGGKDTGPGTLWKVDYDGDVVWTRTVATGENFMNAVAVADGTVYVGGQEGAGALLVAVRDDGTRLWTERWKSEGQDWVGGLVADGHRVYLAATMGLRFERVGQGSRVSMGWGIVRAFDGSGDELWRTRISNDGVVQVESLALGPDALYVGGTTDDAFAGQHNPDGDDAFVLKLGIGDPTDATSKRP